MKQIFDYLNLNWYQQHAYMQTAHGIHNVMQIYCHYSLYRPKFELRDYGVETYGVEGLSLISVYYPVKHLFAIDS